MKKYNKESVCVVSNDGVFDYGKGLEFTGTLENVIQIFKTITERKSLVDFFNAFLKRTNSKRTRDDSVQGIALFVEVAGDIVFWADIIGKNEYKISCPENKNSDQLLVPGNFIKYLELLVKQDTKVIVERFKVELEFDLGDEYVNPEQEARFNNVVWLKYENDWYKTKFTTIDSAVKELNSKEIYSKEQFLNRLLEII